ncbi:MAG: glucosaminidase domain-containing protein [Saprospiraceae bacterium]|jgi:flagellum-specific peptidoglycan hydrolase FlgJ|nr:glucosaminidase domain-containing protein [Saprospiraceae bacterium]
MNLPMIPFKNRPVEELLRELRQKAQQKISQNWPKVALLGFAAIVVSQRDISIDVNLNTGTAFLQEAISTVAPAEAEVEAKPMNTSLLLNTPAPAPPKPRKQPAKHKPADDNLANTFSNMNFNAADGSERALKRQKQLAYVERFHKVAQTEMLKFGIPASITLAQGLLESNVGESKLASNNNNHFGIKCFSRRCPKGHCSNYTDDSHKDFFRKYQSPWESYRAHSILLQKDRYKPLYELGRKDYRNWAHGLKKAGYATDAQYAEKLIATIQDLGLNQYDF